MKKKDNILQLSLNSFLIFLSVLTLFPFVLMVSVSFSNESDILINGYSILPRIFDIAAYRYIFRNPMQLLNAYKVTTIFSFAAMVLSTLLMAVLAYSLTKKELRFRKQISFAIYFTMLFSGGLVPSYILITQYLHLNDTLWVYILPGMISPWYVFMMRTFFADLPSEIEEAAYIDGASHFQIFFKIVIPLSKPVFATVAMFTFLLKWNSWFESMIYINRRTDLYSLQYLLQVIMKNIELLKQETGMAMQLMDEIPSDTVKMAMAVLVAGPALFVFPFFQKYFVKGLTVGSVKG